MNIRKVVCRVSCEEAYEWMQRDLDGELDGAEKEKLMRHQALCRDCASLYERLYSLSTHLEQLPMVEPPFSIVKSILPELDRIDRERNLPPFVQEQAAAIEMPRRNNKAIWYRYIGGATAAGLLISAIVFMLDKPEMKQSAFSSSQMPQVQDATGTKPKSKAFIVANEQREPRQEAEGGPAKSPASDGTTEEAPAADASGSKSAVGDTAPLQGDTKSASPSSSVHASAGEQPKSEEAPGSEVEQNQKSVNKSSSAQPSSDVETARPTESSGEPAESEVAIAGAPDAPVDNGALADKAAPAPKDGKPGISGTLAFIQEEGQRPKREAKAGAAALADNTYKPPGKPSPSQEFFVSKTDNALLVRNAGGGIEFVTHTWNEAYNVSYRWIEDKKIIYKLEYIGRPDGGEASAPQEWLIDLEKNIERPLFNK